MLQKPSFRLAMQKILFITIFISMATFGQEKDNLVQTLMQKSGKFEHILKNPEKYEVQILYTQINRKRDNTPQFKTYQYRINDAEYFYPASTVKLPAVLLALEKLNALGLKGVDKHTPMLTDSAYQRQSSVWVDSSAENGLPSAAHYAKKILLVSDNDAFNRLYELIGQKPFNDKLREKGYTKSRIVHRLEAGMTANQNKHTNPVRFLKGNELLYRQEAQSNNENYFPKVRIKKGIGYMSGDKLMNEPFDFTEKNFFPLTEQQNILKAVLFPESVETKKRFNLKPDDYRFLYQYLSQLPSETTYPQYDTKEIYDSYCKFFIFGTNKNPMPKHIRIFNKVGDAYGYLLDNAYIVDFDKGVEFMLSAVIHCNEDQIFNDNRYEYDSIGYPFYENLGKMIYDYEITRKRRTKPDLSRFKVQYDK